MKIALRKCHTKKITGACGLIKETDSCWALVDRLAELLRKHRHEVLVIEGDNNLSDYEQTRKGCREANNWGADVYISFHMNAFNGSAEGCEYIVYDNTYSNAKQIAVRVMDFMQTLGIKYRRQITNNSFWELKETSMPATIIELLFCDNKHDVDIWNKTSWDTLVYGICNAIDTNIPKNKPIEKPVQPPIEQQGETYFRVVCGSFKNRENAESRKKALEDAGFTSVFLDAYKK